MHGRKLTIKITFYDLGHSKPLRRTNHLVLEHAILKIINWGQKYIITSYKIDLAK